MPLCAQDTSKSEGDQHVRNVIEKLAESVKQLTQLTEVQGSQIQVLNDKVQELGRKLEDLQTGGGAAENVTVGCQRLTSEEQRLCTQLPNIKKQVEQFNNSCNSWSVLWEGLEQILDKGSKVHRQLKAISSKVKNHMFVMGQRNYTELASLLLSAGLPVDAGADTSAGTMLHGAAHSGHLQMVGMLLDHGADANALSSYYGRTPLMEAAKYGHVEVVRCLVQAGADPEIRDKNCLSAHSLSTSNDHTLVNSYFELVLTVP